MTIEYRGAEISPAGTSVELAGHATPTAASPPPAPTQTARNAHRVSCTRCAADLLLGRGRTFVVSVAPREQ
nr:hypothetical protein [Streptomyces sp. alain-838]